MTKSHSGTSNKLPLLSRIEAANYLNISPHTLAEWNSRGHPAIPYFKLGKKCCYSQSDLDEFLQSRRVNGPAASFRPASSKT